MNDLLNDILHSGRSIQREELHTRILACLPDAMTFYIVIVEKRRFSVGQSDVDSDRLFLPFLSFGIEEGRLRIFASPEELLQFTKDAEGSGLTTLWDRPKSIAYVPKAATANISLIENIEKIVLSFYYACGHYDHFMENASRRFVQNFLKTQKTLTLNAVMEAISEYTSCNVTYLQFYTQRGDVKILYDPLDSFSLLKSCSIFTQDLNRAVSRKGTFSGKSASGTSYVINVAAVDRSYETLVDSDQSMSGPAHPMGRTRHVLVLSQPSGPISLDAVKFGPQLFVLHLQNDAFSERERLIFDIHKRAADVERQFVEDPPVDTLRFEKIKIAQYENVLKAASKITAAEFLVLRLYDPFKRELKCVAAVYKGVNVDINHITNLRVDTNASICRCLSEGVKTDLLDVPGYLPSRESNNNVVTDHEIAGIAFPIRIRQLHRGVVECYSSRPAQLQFDEEYLLAISNSIGDVTRRLETASDVAWLSRLSFLHSARHELENFLVLLADSNRVLFNSLRSTLERYSGLGPSPLPSEQGSLSRQVAELMDNAADDFAVKDLAAQVETIEEIFTPDAGFRFVFSEVIATLVSNANKHSTLRAQDFALSFEQTATENLGLAVTYRSADKRIAPSRANQVGVAPIPDAFSKSFHYGLFLAAAQVRMNGGAVHVRTDFEPELDTIPFEICFTVPFFPLGDNDAS